MKICVAVCEYNPFHNGHLYHLNKMKELTGADYVAIIMSGNFTQRGEIAILDKYTRATHAIYAGADIVFELPAVFASASAEPFATGAIKLLSSLNGQKTLCFGCENGNKQTFLSTAKVLNEESKEFKTLLKEELENGVTLAKAKSAAIERMNLVDTDATLLSSSNNILGIEYVRAILSLKSDLDILPLARTGAAFNDEKMYSDFSSGMAIRKAIESGNKRSLKKNVPPYVYRSLPAALPDGNAVQLYALTTNETKDIKKIGDCTEGLENRIKAFLKESTSVDELISKLVTKRYTKTRLQRIVLNNMLDIKKSFVDKCLRSDLYLKVLAINKNSIALLNKLQGEKTYPFITRKSDVKKLSSVAKDCFETDVRANDIYSIISHNPTNEYEMKIIDTTKKI